MHKQVLSAKTLNLSPAQFEAWLLRSRASAESKKRYLRAYKAFHREKALRRKAFKQHVDLRESKVVTGKGVLRITEAKVVTALIFTKWNFYMAWNSLLRSLGCTEKFRAGKEFVTFRIIYRVVFINRKVTRPACISTVVNTGFDRALSELRMKLKKTVFQDSVDAVLVAEAVGKFYNRSQLRTVRKLKEKYGWTNG